MKFHSTLLAAVVGASVLAGCGKGGPLNADSLGNSIGGPTGDLIKAGGHAGNAMALSEKDEDSMGQSVGVVLASNYGVYNNEAIQKYVRYVGMTVAMYGSTNPGGNYVFCVLDTPVVNAYSGPNGYVFVTRGALEKMKDEAELAGVLGHEIAHVCHHDGLNQIKAAEERGALSNLASAVTNDKRFAALSDASVDVVTKTGYTQPQEFDADQDGVKFMTTAGYDPNSYLRFLQRLQQSSANGGGQVMSTHPGIGERVKRVSDEITKMKVTTGATLPERFAKNVPIAK